MANIAFAICWKYADIVFVYDIRTRYSYDIRNGVIMNKKNEW